MDNRLENYKHKESWSRKEKTFSIEVVRWETMSEKRFKEYREKYGSDTGMYVWNVYCYIFPSHKLFNELTEEDFYGGRNIENFHGGSTYCRWYRDENGNVTCKQYGCDYNHYGDDEFTHMKSPEDAYRVFSDAEDLFQKLSKD